MTRKHPKFRTLQKRNLRAEQLEDRRMMDASAVLAEAEWSLGIDDGNNATEAPPVVCGDPAGTPVSASGCGTVKPDGVVDLTGGTITYDPPADFNSEDISSAAPAQYQQAVDALMGHHGAEALVPQEPHKVVTRLGSGVEPIIEPSYGSRGYAKSENELGFHNDTTLKVEHPNEAAERPIMSYILASTDDFENAAELPSDTLQPKHEFSSVTYVHGMAVEPDQQAVDTPMGQHGADAHATDPENGGTLEAALGFILRVSAGADLACPENGTLEPNGIVMGMVGVDSSNGPASGERASRSPQTYLLIAEDLNIEP